MSTRFHGGGYTGHNLFNTLPGVEFLGQKTAPVPLGGCDCDPLPVSVLAAAAASTTFKFPGSGPNPFTAASDTADPPTAYLRASFSDSSGSGTWTYDPVSETITPAWPFEEFAVDTSSGWTLDTPYTDDIFLAACVAHLGADAAPGPDGFSSATAPSATYTSTFNSVVVADGHDQRSEGPLFAVSMGRAWYKFRVDLPGPWIAAGQMIRVHARLRTEVHTGSAITSGGSTSISESGSLAFEPITVDLTPAAGATFAESEVFALPVPTDRGTTVSIVGTALAARFLSPAMVEQRRAAFSSKAGFLPYVIDRSLAVVPVYRTETASDAPAPHAPPAGKHYAGTQVVSFLVPDLESPDPHALTQSRPGTFVVKSTVSGVTADVLSLGWSAPPPNPDPGGYPYDVDHPVRPEPAAAAGALTATTMRLDAGASPGLLLTLSDADPTSRLTASVNSFVARSFTDFSAYPSDDPMLIPDDQAYQGTAHRCLPASEQWFSAGQGRFLFTFYSITQTPGIPRFFPGTSDPTSAAYYAALPDGESLTVTWRRTSRDLDSGAAVTSAGSVSLSLTPAMGPLATAWTSEPAPTSGNVSVSISGAVVGGAAGDAVNGVDLGVLAEIVAAPAAP